jgi:hypothetical protein
MVNIGKNGESFYRNCSEEIRSVTRLDETWVYSSLTIKELCKTNELQEILENGNKGKRLIVFHACSEDGFFCGCLDHLLKQGY